MLNFLFKIKVTIKYLFASNLFGWRNEWMDDCRFMGKNKCLEVEITRKEKDGFPFTSRIATTHKCS